MKRLFSSLVKLVLLVGLITSIYAFKPSPVNAGVCGSCSKSNCCGSACSSGWSCEGTARYGCDCVPGGGSTPIPTGGGGGGLISPTVVVTQRPTVNPNPSPTDFIQACGSGSCTTGFYCCQQLDGSPACCAVGDVLPTSDPRTPTPVPTGTLLCPIYSGCSASYSGYRYSYRPACITSCSLGCDNIWPSYPSDYSCTASCGCTGPTSTPTQAPTPTSAPSSCPTYSGCSGDHPGYRYSYSPDCPATCFLGCADIWPSWPSDYTCSAACGGTCSAATSTPGVPPTTCTWRSWSTCSMSCGGGTQRRSNGCGSTQTRACNTQACPPWIKLKDSSFSSPNNLSNKIALAPVAYDSDDTTDPYFIIGKDGVVAAPEIDLNINTSQQQWTAKTGNPEYTTTYPSYDFGGPGGSQEAATYTPTFLISPSSYLSYVKARKQYSTITNLSEITGAGIYLYNGTNPLNINAPLSSVFNNNIVLITTGMVNINVNFNPSNSVAIVAAQINFSSSVTQAEGIFIASYIDTGTTANQGLKIIGNLVAQTTLTNNREWSTTNKPSLFVKFDQTKYINLLPYLSTANYDWHQRQ